MPVNIQTIELLAPAKDLQAGVAAIQCGADAVYIGADRFSARQAAGNAIDDIRKLIEFAHPYYTKVYVALNTLLYDHELAEAEKIICRLYEMRADGLIIQDMGLLELDLPPVPLIASTQMHNNTPEKVKFLEDVGFSRVILARELTLDQILRIRRHTAVELECFIHGALCVCASGQCYLSYALGGRSANRGQCAQPCRQLYSLEDAAGRTIDHERYLLSLKDLNLSEYIGDLLDAGVCSLKIEGRLKPPAYVANITAHYRRLLDAVLPGKNLRKASSGSVEPGFIPDPAKTFNRGFTDYGITGRSGDMGSIHSPKSTGEMIGKVRRVASDYFELDAGADWHNADGICFFDEKNNLQGSLINRVDGGKIFPQKITGIAPGMLIYRNYDHKFNQVLEKIPARRKIRLRLRLYDTADGVALEGTDEDGNSATAAVVHAKEPAQKVEAARQNILRQFAKLGNTIFFCDDIGIDCTEIYFFPLSTLNQLKRDLIEAVLGVRLLNRPVRTGGVRKNNIPYPQSCLDYTGNVLNEKARRFYQRHGVERIAPAAETGLDLAGKLVMRTKYCIRRQLNLCPGTNAAEPLILIDRQNRRFLLRFRCEDCGMDIFLNQP